MRKQLLAIIIAAGASGCATLQPSQQALLDIDVKRVESVGQQTIDNSRGIDPIRGKVALFDVSETTFEMLANTAKPTDIERAAILELVKLKEAHILRVKEVGAKYDTADQQIIADGWARSRALFADLYNGALTYGEFAKKRQENAATAADAFERKRSSLVAEEARIEAQGEQEAQMRRALIFQNYLNQNPLFQRR